MVSFYGGPRGRGSITSLPRDDDYSWAFKSTEQPEEAGGVAEAATTSTASSLDKEDIDGAAFAASWYGISVSPDSSSGPQSWYKVKSDRGGVAVSAYPTNRNSAASVTGSVSRDVSDGYAAPPTDSLVVEGGVVAVKPRIEYSPPKMDDSPPKIPHAPPKIDWPVPKTSVPIKPITMPKKTPSIPEPPPPPGQGDLHSALDGLDDARRLDFSKGVQFSEAIRRAIRCCAACGEGARAQALFDEFRETDMDGAAYLLAVEGAPACCSQAAIVYQELHRHSWTWICTALFQKRPRAAIRIANVLHRRGTLDADAKSSFQQFVLTPIISALREPVDAGSAPSAILQSIGLGGLGAFTTDVLEALELGTSIPEPWNRSARAEVHRQRLLRRWAFWEESESPGLIAWLAYDLSGGGENGNAAWDLCSNGEAFGRAVVSTEASGSNSGDNVDNLLLPPLALDVRAGHAERRALLALTRLILEQIPAQSSDGVRVEGAVIVYSSHAPDVASIYAMRQFLRLFPWIQVFAGYDATLEQEPIALQEEQIEHIGLEERAPKLEDEPSTNGKGGGKGTEKGKSSGRTDSAAVNGTTKGGRQN